jgi:CRP-like cAMP-binding protein
VLFRADEPLDELYYLLSGEIGATRPRRGGKEDVVDVLLPVQPLCLPAVLLGLPAPVGARTLTVGHLITLPASRLREIVASNPQVVRSVLDDVARDAHELAVKHYVGRMRSIVQRLADYLLSLIKDPEEKPARFILPYNEELLAARFSCTKAGLVHAFSRLRRIGVQKRNRVVIVQDAAALRERATSSGQPTKRRPSPGRPRKVTNEEKGALPSHEKPVRTRSHAKPICKVPDCGKPHHARGYCLAHYLMARPICKVPGCTKPSHAHGYCGAHYNKLRWHGDPIEIVRPEKRHPE